MVFFFLVLFHPELTIKAFEVKYPNQTPNTEKPKKNGKQQIELVEKPFAGTISEIKEAKEITYIFPFEIGSAPSHSILEDGYLYFNSKSTIHRICLRKIWAPPAFWKAFSNRDSICIFSFLYFYSTF